ncbi:MAG: glycosyltransferase 61 family protein [Cyanobacteria bacterium]|nr:glycosyltransferase 61 family protein [Cyanobacteriota bacterium]
MVARVSVVVPFRNAATWLPACLASLAVQRDVAFDLVAVDDGSSDGSAACLALTWRQLGTPAPLRILRLGGEGVSTARNAGWRAAEAELIAFLDADDLCLPGRLAAQAKLLEAEPRLDQVLCGWRRFRFEPGELGGCDVRPWQEGAGFTLEPAFRLKAVLPSAWMLRRRALEACGGFDPALAHAEDVDLLLRLAQAGAPGAWLEQVLCAYRVHPGGASHRLRPQSQALLWVLGRRLASLPASAPLRLQGPELLFAARAWSGWSAWVEDDQSLSLELWRSSWGSSPFGPARTWLHLAQGAERACAREGRPFQTAHLLAHPTWNALENHVLACLQRRERRGTPPESTAAGTAEERHQRGWDLLVHGFETAGLAHWRRQLQAELAALAGRGPWSPWDLAAAWECSDDPVLVVRVRALRWLDALLAWDGQPSGASPLVEGLAALLVGWAGLVWGQSGAAAGACLEKAFALCPDPGVLHALACLHRDHAPSGAAALGQLASRLEQSGGGRADLGAAPLAQRRPLAPGHRCEGPGCQDCGLASLATWGRKALAAGGVLWMPPPPLAEAAAAPLQWIDGGSAWIRDPLASPWGTTAALVICDAAGVRQAQLCRRYPQPWPACRLEDLLPSAEAMAASEPAPTRDPLVLEGTVLAVADLSAEIHYHWLLEQLPRLGMALESLDPRARAQLRIWHNGGNDPSRLAVLQQQLGIEPWQLIDARRHPHIRAERLLVPPFAGRFGWPSGHAQAWLRGRFLPDPAAEEIAPVAPRRRLWLNRRPSPRRPVWGEAALLEQLRLGGVELEAVDLAGMELPQQAATLASAELVVAPHGGALASLVFAGKGTRVLELHQPRYAPPYFHGIVQHQALLLATSEQPAVTPPLYRELVFEGALCEPITLDAECTAAALRALLDLQ